MGQFVGVLWFVAVVFAAIIIAPFILVAGAIYGAFEGAVTAMLIYVRAIVAGVRSFQNARR